jgi:molybdenum cofactor cytidylyltransferase
MGQPKLLLPWDGWTVLDQLLDAWTESQVENVVVVVRRDDEALQEVCRRWPVHLIQPVDDPSDMKQSVLAGLNFLSEFWRPADGDRCFVAPADLPQMTPDLIDRLLSASPVSDQVVVPQFGDRVGHPALFSWQMTRQFYSLPDDTGINSVVEQNARHVVQLSATEYFSDVDTPEDYKRALDEYDPGRQRNRDIESK